MNTLKPEPEPEPELVRAKVALMIEEIRDALTRLGWTPEEIWALSWTVERRALGYAAKPGAMPQPADRT